jgi:hypothetical protein
MAISAISNSLLQLTQGTTSNTSTQNGSSSNTISATTGKNSQVTLATLQKQADSVQQQADIAIRTGHRERLATMTDQMGSIVSGLDKAITGLTTQTLTSSQAKQLKSTLSSTLNTVHSTLSQLSMLVSRNGGTSEKATLSQLGSQTATLAQKVGVTLQSTSVSSIVSGISSRTPHLVDLMA